MLAVPSHIEESFVNKVKSEIQAARVVPGWLIHFSSGRLNFYKLYDKLAEQAVWAYFGSAKLLIWHVTQLIFELCANKCRMQSCKLPAQPSCSQSCSNCMPASFVCLFYSGIAAISINRNKCRKIQLFFILCNG